jgi:hypothetical protein
MKSKNIGRLQEVLNQVNDPDIKEIIDGVFKVEISYRSAERTNFPRQRIRDIIDGVARTIETRKKEVVSNEIPKN